MDLKKDRKGSLDDFRSLIVRYNGTHKVKSEK